MVFEVCKCQIAGAVKEAIETLQRNNVNAFVLDLRNNRCSIYMFACFYLKVVFHGIYYGCSGGLFPEGIEIAKIW